MRNEIVKLGTAMIFLALAVAGLIYFRVMPLPRGRSTNKDVTGPQLLLQEAGHPEPAKSAFAKVPPVTPGGSLEQARALYGVETKRYKVVQSYSDHIWRLKTCVLHVTADASGRIAKVSVRFTNVPIVTPDGIVLGRDTLAVVKDKLQDALLSDQEHLLCGEGTCYLDEKVFHSKEPQWISEYSWFLVESKDSDAKILSQENPVTPNVFVNVPVAGYTIEEALNKNSSSKP